MSDGPSRPGGTDRAAMDDSLYITDDDEDEEDGQDQGMLGDSLSEDEEREGGESDSDGSAMNDYLSEEDGESGDMHGEEEEGAAGAPQSSSTGSAAVHLKVAVSGVSGSDLYSAGPDGVEGVKYGGTCMEMDPEELAQRRSFENDVHKVEQKLGFMIKKLQRSSADHELQISHYIRPPFVLLSTVGFIEDSVMELGEIGEEEAGAAAAGGLANFLGGAGGAGSNAISPIETYLYIWDRYRMVAKDFILQMASDELPSSSAGAALATSADPYANMFLMMPPHPSVAIGSGEFLVQRLLNDVCCVHVHERMTRWFIMMDHYMCTFEEFVSQHKQQNGEQLFRLIKSLNEFYEKSRNIGNKYQFDPMYTNTGAGAGGPSPAVENYDMLLNESEFASYFILYQIDNGKEVPVFIRGLQSDVLQSEDVQFAIKVWTARKTLDYAYFFKLLRTKATYLQACIMYKYVTSTRLQAMRKVTRSYRAGKAEAYLSISRLMRMLVFESEEDTTEFFTYCGYDIEDGFDGEDPASSMCVVLTAGQAIDKMLPVDKNGHAIPPVAKMMELCIESKVLASKFKGAKAVRNFESDKLYISKADICRGVGCTGKRVVHSHLTRWVDELMLNKSSPAGGGVAKRAPPPAASVALRAPPAKKAPSAVAVQKAPVTNTGFAAAPDRAKGSKVALPKSNSTSKLALAGALGGAAKTAHAPIGQTKALPKATPARVPSPVVATTTQPAQSKLKPNALQPTSLSGGRGAAPVPSEAPVVVPANVPVSNFGGGLAGATNPPLGDMFGAKSGEKVKQKKPLSPLSVDRDTSPATSPAMSAHGTTKPPLEQKMKKTAALSNLSTLGAKPIAGNGGEECSDLRSSPAALSTDRGIGFSDNVGIADDSRRPTAPVLSIELPGTKALPPAGPNANTASTAPKAWSFSEPGGNTDVPAPPSVAQPQRAAVGTPMSLQSSRMGTPSLPMSVDATPVRTPPNAGEMTGFLARIGGPPTGSASMALASPMQTTTTSSFVPVHGAPLATGDASRDSGVVRVSPLRAAAVDPLASLTRVFERSAPLASAVARLNRRGDELMRKNSIRLVRSKLRTWSRVLKEEEQRCTSLLQKFCFRKWARVLAMRLQVRTRFLSSFQDSTRRRSEDISAAGVLLNRRARKRENKREHGQLTASCQWALDRDKLYFHLHGPNLRYQSAGGPAIPGTTSNSLFAMLHHRLGSDFSPQGFTELFPSPCDILAPHLYYLQSLYVYCLTRHSSPAAAGSKSDPFTGQSPLQLFACSQRSGKTDSVGASGKWHGNLMYKLTICSSASCSGEWEFKHHKPICGFPNNFSGRYLSPNILRSLLTTEKTNSTLNPVMVGLHEKAAICHNVTQSDSPSGALFGNAQTRRQTRVSVVDLCATYCDPNSPEPRALTPPAPDSPFVQGCNGAVLIISEYDMICSSDEEFANSMQAQLVCLMKNRHSVRSPHSEGASTSIPPVVLIFTRDRLMKSPPSPNVAEKSAVDWYVLSMEHYHQQVESGMATGTCDDDVHMVQSVLQRIQALVGVRVGVNFQFQLKGVYIVNTKLNEEQGFPYFDLVELAQFQLCLSGAINMLAQTQSLNNARSCTSEEELMVLDFGDGATGDSSGSGSMSVGVLLEQNCACLTPLVEKIEIAECTAERVDEAIWNGCVPASASASSSRGGGMSMGVDQADGCRIGDDVGVVLDGIELVIERLIYWLQFSTGAMAVAPRSDTEIESIHDFVFPQAMIAAFPPVDFCSLSGGVTCDAALFKNRVVGDGWGDSRVPHQWNCPAAATNSNISTINACVGIIQSLSTCPVSLHDKGQLEARILSFTQNLDQLAGSCSGATNINLWRGKLSKSARGLVGLVRAAESVPEMWSLQYNELRRLWDQRLPAWKRAVAMLYQFVIKSKFRGIPTTLFVVAEVSVPPIGVASAPTQSAVGIGALLQNLTGTSAAGSKRRKREDDVDAFDRFSRSYPVTNTGNGVGADGVSTSAQVKKRITLQDVSVTLREVSAAENQRENLQNMSSAATSVGAHVSASAPSPASSLHIDAAASTAEPSSNGSCSGNKEGSTLNAEMGDEYLRTAAFNAFMAKQLLL